LVKEFLVQKHFHCKGPEQTLLALDYCPGGELFMLLRQKKRFDLQTLKFYAANIILGLDALHSLGIVYRDLKPENVLINSDGYTKLCDFGLSLILETDKEEDQQKDNADDSGRESCSSDRNRLNSSFSDASSSSSLSLKGFKCQEGPKLETSTTFFGTLEYTPPEFFKDQTYNF